MVANLAERFTMAQNAQKRFLHGVFGIRLIAQNGKSYAVESGRILVDQRRQCFLLGVLASFVMHGALDDLHPTWN